MTWTVNRWKLTCLWNQPEMAIWGIAASVEHELHSNRWRYLMEEGRRAGPWRLIIMTISAAKSRMEMAATVMKRKMAGGEKRWRSERIFKQQFLMEMSTGSFSSLNVTHLWNIWTTSSWCSELQSASETLNWPAVQRLRALPPRPPKEPGRTQTRNHKIQIPH